MHSQEPHGFCTSLIGLEKADYKQIKYLHIVLRNNIIQILILDNNHPHAYEVQRP